MKACLCASKGAAQTEPVLYRGEYEGLFKHAKSLGFDGVEIHLREAADVDAEQLLRESERSGVALAAIATGLAKRIDGLELVARDEAARLRAIRRLEEQIDLAHIFGCQIIIGSMRGNIPAEDGTGETRALLLRSMRHLADYIQNKNCGIVFEAINRYENNYLNTAGETADFVQELGSPKVKVLLDTFHMGIEEKDPAAAIRAIGKHLGHIHLADNTRSYPGSGVTNFSAILRALRDIDYEGWLSFEYLPLPDEDTAARRGLEYIRHLRDCLS